VCVRARSCVCACVGVCKCVCARVYVRMCGVSMHFCVRKSVCAQIVCVYVRV
jgi:hypothetical protein